MGRIIVVTSGKGGVGKTTATASIGTALAGAGKEVLLVDMDIGLRNLDVVLGLENRIVFDIVDVVEGKCRLQQAIIRDRRDGRLSVMPASQTRDKNALEPEQVRTLMDEVRGLYDYVLLDCPAGIEQGFRNAIAGADEAIVVCTPDVSSVRDADRVIGLMAAEGIGKISLLVNRMRADLVRRGDMLSSTDVEEILGQKAIGVIPEDPGVVRASNVGEAVVSLNGSRAGREYTAVARRLMGETVPVKTGGFGTLVDKLLRRERAC